MRQELFSACHNHTDPEPYITACTETLCTYPDVDGLSCQFMEAYAKSCNLQSNMMMTDWQDAADCRKIIDQVSKFEQQKENLPIK